MKLRNTSGWCALALALAACGGNPVAGDWENAENDSSMDDRLVLDADGSGFRTMEEKVVQRGVTVKVVVEWVVDWEEQAEGDYDVSFICDDALFSVDGDTVRGCHEVVDAFGARFDAEAECTLNAAKDELECQDIAGDEVTFEKL